MRIDFVSKCGKRVIASAEPLPAIGSISIKKLFVNGERCHPHELGTITGEIIDKVYNRSPEMLRVELLIHPNDGGELPSGTEFKRFLAGQELHDDEDLAKILHVSLAQAKKIRAKNSSPSYSVWFTIVEIFRPGLMKRPQTFVEASSPASSEP